MSNYSVLVTDAAKYQSPQIDEHKRRVLKVYAYMLINWAELSGTDYRTTNLALLFSRARALFAAVPDIDQTASKEEVAILMARALGSTSLAGDSVSSQLAASAAWLNQTDRALDEATLYLEGVVNAGVLT